MRSNFLPGEILKVACITPVFNGGDQLIKLVDSLLLQSIKADLFFVDSCSRDGSLELLESRFKNIKKISARNFNHGGTRQNMVDENLGYDVYIFLTQDCYLENPFAIENLIKPFDDSSVGAVCGRQLPHTNATKFAEHARLFNYPEGILIKKEEDIPRLGIKTAFLSNSFAAYRAKALYEVGGFPRNVIFGEDMYVAAKLLIAGWSIAYAGNAECRHSHNYTLAEEFRRYFDMGVFHSREHWILEKFGGAGGEGVRYVKSELSYLGLKNLHLWPESMLRNLIKYIASRAGVYEGFMPNWIKKNIGMNGNYWHQDSNES